MSDFDRNIAAARGGYGADRALATDAGLRAYMIRVYNLMAGGIAFTGIAAWLTYQAAGGDAIRRTAAAWSARPSSANLVLGGFTPIVLMLVTLGLVFFISFRIDRLQPTTAFGVFTVYAGLMGVALASIFLVYTGVSIARVFFITAATFGAMSLYGYTTKRDLSGFGSFLFMGLIGLILASLVNICLGELDDAVHHLGSRRADLRRPDRLRHAADQGNVRRQRRRHRVRPQGHHGRAAALPRLPQSVHHAAAAVRRPPLTTHSRNADAPAKSRGVLLL